jgi:alginate O-acetyltransferase complex protein AlgI
MLFVEFRFFVFFLIVFCVYWAMQSNTARKIWLLFSSYFFYSAFFIGSEIFTGGPLKPGWWFPFMLMASTCMDYVVGLRVEDAKSERARRLWLSVSVCVNIGVLLYFKYMGFFIDSVQAFTAWVGLPASIHTLKIILPVGVSFYTFQSMSYTIEVYRKHRPAERNALNLATFIAFFPQLVAGPIVRAASFLPQMAEKRRWADVDVRAAVVLFLVGFVKKACVSDAVAQYVDQYFANPYGFTNLSGVIAVLLYAVQIYCDFSGYTDMAIAAARLLGYELTINFDFPYFSKSVTEFWRRWHISLSTWLRDYLYISLGGNRGSRAFVYRNLLLTMVLGGLWHGSRWTFVVWGTLHGLALVAHREYDRLTPALKGLRESKLGQLVATVATFYFVCVCWIFFRAADLTKPMTGDDFQRALHVLGSFTGLASHHKKAHLQSLDPTLLLFFAGLAIIHWLSFKRVFSNWWRRMPDYAFASACGCAAAVILLFIPTKYAPFIYFQF